MPRSLLEILLEKKDPKKSLPYPTRDQFNIELAALEKMCSDNLSELFGTENFGGVNTFGTIRDRFKDCQKTLEKYRLEWKDYPWNDPTVQKGLVTQKKDIAGLIKIVNLYRTRSDKFFELILKRQIKIKMAPFQVILLGANDLRRTVKKIVNLAT